MLKRLFNCQRTIQNSAQGPVCILKSIYECIRKNFFREEKNPYLKGSSQRPQPKPSHKGSRPENQLSQ